MSCAPDLDRVSVRLECNRAGQSGPGRARRNATIAAAIASSSSSLGRCMVARLPDGVARRLRSPLAPKPHDTTVPNRKREVFRDAGLTRQCRARGPQIRAPLDLAHHPSELLRDVPAQQRRADEPGQWRVRLDQPAPGELGAAVRLRLDSVATVQSPQVALQQMGRRCRDRDARWRRPSRGSDTRRTTAGRHPSAR